MVSCVVLGSALQPVNKKKTVEIPETVAYARVSSREQAENSAALNQQIARLKAAGAELVLIDVESGRESKESDRPNFQKVMGLVRDGLVRKVIITRLDRLSRSLPTLRKSLDVFQRADCILVALDDNIDLSTAAGKFHLNMLGALAEMESDRLSERISRGKEHFRQMKRASHAPFGYVIRNYCHYPDREPFLCLLEEQKEYSKADMARELVEYYISHRSLTAACKYFPQKFGFQQFWQSAMGKWLTSPTLQGDLVYFPKSKDPKIHPNIHEPLMTRDEAKTIKEILVFNKKVGGFGYKKGVHPLSGLVRCECGGGGISATGSKKRINYFICCRYRMGTCHRKHGLRMSVAESAVIQALTKRAEMIAQFADVNTVEDSPALKDLRGQLADLEAITVIPNRTVNPAISEAIRSLRDEIYRLEQQSQLQGQFDTGNRELLMLVASRPDFWETQEVSQKQRFFRLLVDHVLMSDGKLLEVFLKV